LNAILLPKRSIGYQDIPKVACTSIKHALYQLRTGRKFSREEVGMHIHQYFGREYRSISNANVRFIVLRDPVKRFLSAYSNRVGHHKELSKKFLEKSQNGRLLLEKNELMTNPSLENFIKYFKDYQTIRSINHHTKPIVSFGIGDLNFFTHIYKIEELKLLEADISTLYNTTFKLPRLQTEGIKYKVSDLSKEELSFLFDFYKEDYALLSNYYTKEMILEEWILEKESINIKGRNQ
jgi:hypothetical protein